MKNTFTPARLGLAALSAVAMFAANATPSEAAPPATGWDDTPQVIVGGGSDTTYLVMQRLGALYNGAPGCTMDTSSTSANKGKCVATQPASVVTNGNYDHDAAVEAAPIGSGAGVNSLLSTGVAYNPGIDYARSSRGPSGTEANDTTFWGYGRDAIAVITFGSRSTVALTRQDLIDIYKCTKTDWSQFGEPAGTIVPWDMNNSSGTFSVFRDYLKGADATFAFGSCVRSLAGGVKPFENDVKPVLADAGPDATQGTADDDPNNYLWWMSFGNWATYPYTKNGVDGTSATVVNSSLAKVETLLPEPATISGNTYPILRTLYHVTRNTDVDCRQSPGSAGTCDNAANAVYGATSGKGGAVRQFTEFLCRQTNSVQAINPVSGRGYRSEVVSALNLEGFQQVPSTGGLRTTGYACQVFT